MLTRDSRVFLLTACAMFYSFASGAMRPDAKSVVDDPAMLLRMAIPALAGLFALVLRNKPAGSGDRPQYATALDLGVAIAFVLLSQWLLALLRPQWMLPRWIPSQGALVGWWFIAILRTLLPPAQPDEDPVDDGEDRRWRTGTVVVTVAALVFGVMAVAGAKAAPVRAGGAFMMGGALYMSWGLRRLERKTEICRQACFCYMVTVVPAAAFILWGHGIYIFNFMLYILLGAELIYRGSERIEADSLAPAL